MPHSLHSYTCKDFRHDMDGTKLPKKSALNNNNNVPVNLVVCNAGQAGKGKDSAM